MFTSIIDAIRAYIIRKIAEQVANDIIETGLTEADRATIDEILNG